VKLAKLVAQSQQSSLQLREVVRKNRKKLLALPSLSAVAEQQPSSAARSRRKTLLELERTLAQVEQMSAAHKTAPSAVPQHKTFDIVVQPAVEHTQSSLQRSSAQVQLSSSSLVLQQHRPSDIVVQLAQSEELLHTKLSYTTVKLVQLSSALDSEQSVVTAQVPSIALIAELALVPCTALMAEL
jgi:hypothetical protein